MFAHLQIAEDRAGNVVIVRLTGQLVAEEDALGFRNFVDALIQSGARRLVVNLRDLSYIDSCGVGSLVAKFVTIKQLGGHLKLACPNSRVLRILTITGLLAVFEIFDSEDAAVRSFAAPSPAPADRQPLAG